MIDSSFVVFSPINFEIIFPRLEIISLGISLTSSSNHISCLADSVPPVRGKLLLQGLRLGSVVINLFLLIQKKNFKNTDTYIVRIVKIVSNYLRKNESRCSMLLIFPDRSGQIRTFLG